MQESLPYAASGAYRVVSWQYSFTAGIDSLHQPIHFVSNGGSTMRHPLRTFPKRAMEKRKCGVCGEEYYDCVCEPWEEGSAAEASERKHRTARRFFEPDTNNPDNDE